ncbi:MAG: hypothetical protein JXR34_09510 [Bacteroidales bacterium]|nr:hypothetical protein [Bacteroidales bacterium]
MKTKNLLFFFLILIVASCYPTKKYYKTYPFSSTPYRLNELVLSDSTKELNFETIPNDSLKGTYIFLIHPLYEAIHLYLEPNRKFKQDFRTDFPYSWRNNVKGKYSVCGDTLYLKYKGFKRDDYKLIVKHIDSLTFLVPENKLIEFYRLYSLYQDSIPNKKDIYKKKSSYSMSFVNKLCYLKKE